MAHLDKMLLGSAGRKNTTDTKILGSRVMQSKCTRQSSLNELVNRRKNAAARKVSGTQFMKRNPMKNVSTYASEETVDNSSDHEDDDMLSRAKYEDVKKIMISRSQLEKWFCEPFFDKLIKGCLVRIGIGISKQYGPTYRLCVVRNVDATKVDRMYTFGNRSMPKFLNVVWGNENSAARWKMTVVSNSPPLRNEFDQLAKEADRYSGYLPTKQEVFEKIKDIKKTKFFVYSAEIVKQMVEEKRSIRSKPFNVAAEKVRLRDELERTKGDKAKVERIKSRLTELETIVRGKQTIDKKAIRLEQMNKKNKVEGVTNALKPCRKGLGQDGENVLTIDEYKRHRGLI